MFTTKTAPCSRLLFLGLLLAGLAASRTAAAEVVWPTTFSGQPEFSFDKTKLSEEQQRTAVGRGKLAGTDPVAALSGLVRKGIADPFAAEETNAPVVNIQGPQLNDLLLDAQADLNEFKNYINRLIADSAEPRDEVKDFSNDINQIIIQSLVASPTPYVTINNQRYTVGDEFTLTLKPKDNSARIASLIDLQIPDKSTVSEEVFREYIKLKTEALDSYKSQLNEANSITGGHKISVVIKAIAHRQLTVSILDKDYTLKLGTVL